VLKDGVTLQDTVLSLEDICFTYGAPASSYDAAARAGTLALGPVSQNFRKSEITAIIGPSGCGKSTLLRIIGGLRKPSQGKITGHHDNAKTGFVFQDPTLLAWQNIRDNVCLPMQLAGLSKAEQASRAQKVLELVGLETWQDSMPRQLSGGMKMRVSLARALVGEPNLLLFDEPFAALDELTRNRLDEELRQIIMDRKATGIFVTHSLSESVFLADRILVFSHRPGRIIFELEVEGPDQRDADWRRAPRFHEHCAQLSELMTQDSREFNGGQS